MKYYSKSELATLAGVSYSTFYRFLKTHRQVLYDMGVSIYAQKLPPNAVRFLCEKYCIDIEE